MTLEYDLVVLGGGPGGYVAAMRASQLGMKVALVEKNEVGGTCLHNGCIPSKTLLKSAEKYRNIRQSNQFGIDGIDEDALSLNIGKVNKRKNTIITQLHNGVKHLLKGANVDVFNGVGRILGPSIFSPLSGTISVEYKDGRENSILSPKFVLVATGSKQRELPELIVDNDYILDSTAALNLKDLPRSVIIVGGGVIGIEFASMLRDFGVDVTVIELGDHILATEDNEIRNKLERSLSKRGIIFIKNCQLDTQSLEKSNVGISIDVVTDQKTKSLNTEKIIIAAGRKPNIENIGIENTKIVIEDQFIRTNEMYQTEESHIYAIGDCIGGMELAHVATREGIIAVEHMANKKPEPLNYLNVPSCIYSYPEISRIGLTEEEATENNYEIKVGKFPFSNIGKAAIDGEQDGFIKIISDKKTEDILGIHMIGTHVTELISEGSLAKMLDATPWEISHTVHPHPSISETFMEAALAVNDEQIHG